MLLIVRTLRVAACDGTHQLAVLVFETDGSAVELQLAAYLEGLVELTHGASPKVVDFLFVVGVAKRQHRRVVLHLLKVLTDVAAHALRWTVGVEELRIFLLELLQLLEFEVELHVADGRRVEHIVVVVVPIELVAQRVDFLLY